MVIVGSVILSLYMELLCMKEFIYVHCKSYYDTPCPTRCKKKKLSFNDQLTNYWFMFPLSPVSLWGVSSKRIESTISPFTPDDTTHPDILRETITENRDLGFSFGFLDPTKVCGYFYSMIPGQLNNVSLRLSLSPFVILPLTIFRYLIVIFYVRRFKLYSHEFVNMLEDPPGTGDERVTGVERRHRWLLQWRTTGHDRPQPACE